MQAVRAIVARAADLNVQTIQGQSPLHLAAQHGLHLVAEELAKRGADCNLQDSNQETPLHLASRQNHAEVVYILLEYGALPGLRNVSGKKASDLAASKKLKGSIKKRKSKRSMKRK